WRAPRLLIVFASSFREWREHPAEDLQPHLVELDHELFVGAGERALDDGAGAERRVRHPVAARESLHRRRGRRGLDLALQVALLVALPRWRHRRAPAWGGEHGLRDVGQETARKRRLGAAVEVAPESAAQVEAVLRARHSYICEPPLLGHLGR